MTGAKNGNAKWIIAQLVMNGENKMYRIIDGRGTGKTSRLMLLAKENDAIFVCNDPHCMEAKAQAYGITGIQFVSYYDYLRLNYNSKHKNVVIDELEFFLNHILKGQLIGYTLSYDD